MNSKIISYSLQKELKYRPLVQEDGSTSLEKYKLDKNLNSDQNLNKICNKNPLIKTRELVLFIPVFVIENPERLSPIIFSLSNGNIKENRKIANLFNLKNLYALLEKGLNSGRKETISISLRLLIDIRNRLSVSLDINNRIPSYFKDFSRHELTLIYKLISQVDQMISIKKYDKRQIMIGFRYQFYNIK